LEIIGEIPIKICEECKEKEIPIGWSRCSTCYSRKWRAENTEQSERLRVRGKYNITLEYYRECMESSHCCEICGIEDNLCYDHDHITGGFRGVLCKKCNISLGGLGDTLQDLNRAVTYLKKGESKDGRD
jgi:hypothetical protein